MDRRVLYSVCALLFSMALSSSYGLVENDHHEDHVEMMLEPFERIKDLLNIHSKGLTLLGVNNLIRKLFSRIHCNSPTAATGGSATQPCGQSLVRYTCTIFLILQCDQMSVVNCYFFIFFFLTFFWDHKKNDFTCIIQWFLFSNRSKNSTLPNRTKLMWRNQSCKVPSLKIWNVKRKREDLIHGICYSTCIHLDIPPSGAFIHDKKSFCPLNNWMKWNLFDVKIYWRKHK